MTHPHHGALRLRARIAAVSGGRDGNRIGASDGHGDHGRKAVRWYRVKESMEAGVVGCLTGCRPARGLACVGSRAQGSAGG